MTGCIEWPFGRDRNGYGIKTILGRQWRMHRYIYQMYYGADLGELIVRHTCDNPPCINPDHLIPGTHAENARDKSERGRARNQYTNVERCKRNHEFTDENTYINPASNNRQCRTCRREDNRRRRAEARAA